jgi:hypothetical protein
MIIDELEGKFGKEKIEKFLEAFNNATKEETPDNKMKEVNIKLNAENEPSNGIGIEIGNINKDNSNNYNGGLNEELKSCFTVFDVSIGVSPDSDKEKITGFINKMKEIIENIDILKDMLETKEVLYNIALSDNLIHVSIGISSDSLNSLTENIGINLMEYQSLKIYLKSSVSFEDARNAEEIINKLQKAEFGIEGRIKSPEFLCRCFLKALKTIKVSKDKSKKRLKKIKCAIATLEVFNSLNINLSYNSAELAAKFLDANDDLNKESFVTELQSGIDEQLETLKALNVGQQIVGMTEEFGFGEDILDIIKSFNLDSINIGIFSPKSEAGGYIQIALPGITKLILEFI